MAYPLSYDAIIIIGTTGRVNVGASVDIDAYPVFVTEEELCSSTWAF